MQTIAIIGVGVRGRAYGDILSEWHEKVRITAVCDPNPKKLRSAAEKYGVECNRCFTSDSAFFEAGRLADALLICTQDCQHFVHAKAALELGYHILLEKPISTKLDECFWLAGKAKESGRLLSICHELRYSFFTQQIKTVLESGVLGEVVMLQQTERVGYFHQAHSYVRGSWNRKACASPMILSKCCHDLDLLAYFAGAECQCVSSFGGLRFFHRGNQPANASDYCYQCSIRATCPYDCISFYQNNQRWAERAGCFLNPCQDEDIRNWLSDQTNPYARCVFACDNDVVDHQVVNMRFQNGVCANLTMTAFSKDESRMLSIFGTYGELAGDMEKHLITVKPFGKSPYIIDVQKIYGDLSGHGGGDRAMVEDFLLQLEGAPEAKALTGIEHSIQSHLIALAAEQSRLNGGQAIKLDADRSKETQVPSF